MMRTAGALGVMVVAALLLSACGRGDQLQRLNAARQYLQDGQANAAVVELKSLVQERPESREIRFLYGRALLEAGDPAGAEVQLRRVDPNDPDHPQARSLIALTLLAQGKTEAMLNEFEGTSFTNEAASAELASEVALAQATLGRLDAARATALALLERNPGHVAGALLLARLTAARGDGRAATEQAEGLRQREPNNPKAWALIGDLAQARGDVETATAAYGQALTLSPKLVAAHSGLMTLLLRRRDEAGAARRLADMKRALPGKVETVYFEALLAQMKGDARQAQALLQPLLRTSPNQPQVLLLASLAELQLGARSSAQRLLEKGIAADPKSTDLRRQLARVHLQAGQPDNCLDALRTLTDSKSQDAEALTLAGQAYLLLGDVKRSEQYFSRASVLRPGDPEVRAALGRAYLATGRIEPGLRELQAAASSDPHGSDADVALISARMRRKEFGAAAKALDALVAKQPAQALPEHLRGYLALQERDFQAARRHFENALVKDAAFFPAVVRLAELDLAENRLDSARKRYEDLLDKQPDHTEAMLALAAQMRRVGRPVSESAAWLDKAVKLRPKDAGTWMAAIDQRLQSGDGAGALALTNSALLALPDQLELIERLAVAQIAVGDGKAAVASASRLLRAMPAAPVRLLLADAYLAAGDGEAAELQVRSALMALGGDSEGVQRSGAAMASRRGKPALAIELARQVQTRDPTNAFGWRLEGDAHASAKNWEPAAAAFRQALVRKNPADSVVRLHWALMSAGKAAEAQRLEQSWLKDRPGDVRFLMHLGERAMVQGDWAVAEARFRRALELAPEHPLALNNLANLMLHDKRAGALALAERAARAAPGNADILDTLATVHAQEGRTAQAIEWELRALALAPNSGGYRLNLARVYRQAGDRAGARRELEVLAKLGSRFSAHEEVQRLLREP